MNTFKYLLLGSLFLASCSEQEEFKRPGETGGETIEVTQDIQVNVLPMQSIASPATRSAANGKPEKGEAVHLTYGGGGATTRVQTGSDPMSADESKIHNAYIVQFDGTAPTSTVAWVSGDIKSQLGSATPITCSFSMAAGKKNRVYVIANIASTSVPKVGTTTLADFEKPVSMPKDLTLPVSGLPMSAMQDIGVGDAFDVFQLRSVLAKLTFTCETAGATLKLINVSSGYTFFTQSRPGDNAVRPSGMTYSTTGTTLTSGTTYYVPENMSGRNDLLIYPYTRALGMAPANAIYVEITDGATTYNLLLGDGSAPDFNFTGGYAYNIKAAINGTDTYDLRVGNPFPVGTAIIDLNAQAGGKTANCYIAGANTWYTFNSTVMGNGATTSAYGAANAADIIPSKLNPASADVLWETVNTGTAPAPGAIVNKNLYFLKDRILFKSGSTQGNAVIAARDVANQIIWSWHIWRINAEPSAILLKDITDGKGFLASGIQMMDRNLGALETPSTDPHTYLSMGFLYQWGRKDPFPNTAAFSPGSWAAATNVNFSADQSTGPASSMAMSIASPTRFFVGVSASSYTWCTTRNDNYWGTPSTSNTVKIGSTSYDSNRGSKTIYDPCPPGWRVPAQYVYANAVSSTTNTYTDGIGLDLNGFATTASMFLPAAGYRNSSTGASFNQSIGGYYWASSVPSGSVNASYVYFNSATLNATSSNRAVGFSVRCVQEQ